MWTGECMPFPTNCICEITPKPQGVGLSPSTHTEADCCFSHLLHHEVTLHPCLLTSINQLRAAAVGADIMVSVMWSVLKTMCKPQHNQPLRTRAVVAAVVGSVLWSIHNTMRDTARHGHDTSHWLSSHCFIAAATPGQTPADGICSNSSANQLCDILPSEASCPVCG